MAFTEKYLEWEEYIIEQLNRIPHMDKYTYHKTSSRITLGLLVLGFIAIINELYITIDMWVISKNTYDELRTSKLENLINHEMLLNERKYFGTEYKNKKGQIVENFEDMKEFYAKPVHVAHLYVACAVLDKSKGYQPVIDRPLRFHFEFSPEEFEGGRYRPEYGCSLKFLKTKIYHFFKDSELFEELIKKGYKFDNFKISQNVHVFNPFDESLRSSKLDDLPLCFLKIETGDRLKCEITI